MLNHIEAIAIQPLGIARLAVVKLSEVLPDHFLPVVLATGVGDSAVRFVDEPFRVLTRQRRVNGTVIDLQVEHDFESGGVRLAEHLADLVLGWNPAARSEQIWIDFEIILDGIEAARGAGPLDRIDEGPVEADRRRSLKMVLPARKWGCEVRN